MIRALWFFLQLAIVVCAAIWISTQRGTVDVAWNDYTISLHLGIFLLFLTLFTIIAVAFFRIIGAVINFPAGMSRRRRERNRKKGFQALTRGFVAIAAGDAKKATALARDVRHLLPDEMGLPLLLEAQAARLRGDEGAARQTFEQLLLDKDAGFFGVRGLLKSSLDEGDHEKALAYARDALAQNPKQPWVLKSVYDLEILSRRWSDAMRTLDRARKVGAIDARQARRDEIALLMIQAENDHHAANEKARLKTIEHVIKIDPAFTPAVTALAQHYLDTDKPGKAAGVIERAWKINPHPDLAALWDRAIPKTQTIDPLRRLRWCENLLAFRPDSVDGQLAAARAAMEAGLNGEARAHLVIAENLRASAAVFRLRADVEESAGAGSAAVRGWLDQAASAVTDPVWYCTVTGTIYERWSALAQPHGSFNTIVWGNPVGVRVSARPVADLDGWQDPLLIEKI